MTRMVTGLGVAVLLGLTACADTTEPVDVAELRVANVATGGGTYTVTMDGQRLGQLEPLRYAYAVVRNEPHLFVFEDATTELSVETPADDITAVVVMNAPAPELRAFQMERLLDEEWLTVVNADTAAGDLTVVLEGADGVISPVTLGQGEGERVELDGQAYDVLVHRGDIAQADTLEAFTLRGGDHGYLVIFPAESETERYGRFLF